MNTPTFYSHIEPIVLLDDLSLFLGALEDGKITFTYLDLVKIAGHSCPTVLGAYLMTKEGLKALYPNELPKRGEIKVEFAQNSNQGVTGVTANVISAITGATETTGFKGLMGSFDRRFLMSFEQEIPSTVRFTRTDTQKSVDVFYDPSAFKPNAIMQELMQKCLQQKASEDEKNAFRRLWQERVERIALNESRVLEIKEVV